MILGVDIGGANIKLATESGYARSVDFRMWVDHESLQQTLAELFAAAPAHDKIAATMTGELADCFESKAEGVRHIAQAAAQAASDKTTECWFYSTEGRFFQLEEAMASPEKFAAANWHGLTQLIAKRFAGPGLLIDIGSTTTDIIPFGTEAVLAIGKTDPERLGTGELIYSAVRRTPVCAVIQSLPINGTVSGVAAEWFATMHDVYQVRGDVPEEPESTDTCDGKPATRANAGRRLARMICADVSELTDDQIAEIASHCAAAQFKTILDAAGVLAWRHECQQAVVAGEGEFLARRVAERLGLEVTGFADEFGDDASRCAPAFAVATLLGSGGMGSGTFF